MGGKSWHELTHTLKGAARGVGAFGLADVAAEAEKISDGQGAAIDVVHRLKNKVLRGPPLRRSAAEQSRLAALTGIRA